MTVLAAGRPFRSRLTSGQSRRVSEGTGPPQDDDEAATARQLIDQELTSVIDRLKRLQATMRETLRADDIAPLPAVYEDGEGET